MRVSQLFFGTGAALGLAIVLGGCGQSAQGRDNPGGGGNAGLGAGASAGLIGPPGSAGMVVGLGGGPPSDAGACQQAEVRFEPKIATVFLLVDRSGSMFTGTSPAWDPLRTGVLQVIQSLETEVRFGFAAFTGQAGATCPVYDDVPANLNNYAAIQALYQSLNMPDFKAETPTMRALPLVRDALLNDPTDGPKYILFVTDGEPDYCGDGNAICAVDAVTFRLQELAAQGIPTIVFGIQTPQTDVPATTLQAWANAGAGQPVAQLMRDNQTLTAQDIYNQCFNNGDPNGLGWKMDFTTAGRQPNTSLGAYMPTGGTATVYKPDPLDQEALTTQLRSVINNVKSCTFDLQGQIEVNLTRAGEGAVLIDGTAVPYEPTNGWRMVSATQLQLEGSSCARWRDTGMRINFEFPCDIIVVVR